MNSNLRNTVASLILLAMPVLTGTVLAGEDRQLHGSGLVPANQKARTFARMIPAQAKPADVKSAEPAAKSPEERTPEEKQRIKTAVVLLSVLSGIALSGLLLIIAAVAIRGLQRKLAGPTRLDRDPADLLAAAQPAPSGGPPKSDPASQETRVT